MPTGQQPQKGGKQNETKTLIYFMIMALIVTSIINIFLASVSTMSLSEITYSQFQQMLDEGKVETVEIGTDRLIITEKKDASKTERLILQHRMTILDNFRRICQSFTLFSYTP